jgi:hypothetical protein
VYRKHLYIALLALLTLNWKQSNAQELEYGGWIGVTNYFGDLNSNASFEFLGPAGGLFFRYNLGTRFAFKQGLNYGKVSFEDAVSEFSYQQSRNLSFKSDIVEFSSHVEFNFFKYDREKKQHSFTPYLLVGISVFYFNPKAEYEGEMYALQPLQTEEKKYSRINVAIPLGGGFKYSFTPYWTLGMEGGFRKTFTDYLDDVSDVYPGFIPSNGDPSLENALSDRSGEVTDPSIGKEGKQRGFREFKDGYLFFGISISYSPIRMKCPKPSRILP